TFGSGSSAFQNTDLTSSPSQATITALWSDLVTFDPQSSVFWEVRGTGTSRRLIVEWKDVAFFPGGAPFLTFQAVLGADGSLQFNYLNVNNGPRGTAGVKAAGTQGPSRLLLAFNNGPNQFVGNNLSTRMVFVVPQAGGDYYSFTVGANERVTLVV